MTTIRDIAKKSGYAKSTVSRYINGNHYVSARARRVIQQAIDELDYRPNQVARDLSTGCNHKIGVIVPNTKCPYIVEMMRGLTDAAISAQHELILLPSNYQQTLELEYLEKLRMHDYESLIFTSSELPLSKIASYRQYGKIICTEDAREDGLSSVYLQRQPGYVGLFHWLRQRKINKMALLFERDRPQSPTYRATMHCFHRFFAGIDYQVFHGLVEYSDAPKILGEVVRGNFDCILANSDDIAAYFLQNLPKKGGRLPLIVSQESQLSGKLLRIPSIDDRAYELGERLFQAAVAKEDVNMSLSSRFILR